MNRNSINISPFHRIFDGMLTYLMLLLLSCRSTANETECQRIAQHVAQLTIAHEKQPPLGKLVPPFASEAHEREIYEQAQKEVFTRCTKGWLRETCSCMQQATSLTTVEECRKKHQP